MLPVIARLYRPGTPGAWPECCPVVDAGKSRNAAARRLAQHPAESSGGPDKLGMHSTSNFQIPLVRYDKKNSHKNREQPYA